MVAGAMGISDPEIQQVGIVSSHTAALLIDDSVHASYSTQDDGRLNNVPRIKLKKMFSFLQLVFKHACARAPHEHLAKNL